MSNIGDEHGFIVYVNSRERVSGTDSDFLYSIQMPQDRIMDSVVVLNALIPKSYYLIQEGFNTFQLQEGSTIVTITVPVGSYILSGWTSTLSSLLTAASPNALTYLVTYPTAANQTGKLLYTQSNGAIQSALIFTNLLFEPFGFQQSTTNLFTGTTLVSATVIKLQSEDRLLIHSDCVQNPSTDNVLVSINAVSNVNFSSIAYINYHPEYNSHTLNSGKNSTFRFTLTDENNNIMDLNGLNLNMTLLFYKKNTSYQQIASTQEQILVALKYIAKLLESRPQ